MNRTTLILVAIATVLISIILPFIFKDKTETFNQTLTLTATIISAISAVLTFVIAILLYNKFGIETPLLEKNTSVVIAFLEELKKTRFSISSERYELQIIMHDPYYPTLESYYSDKLLFSLEYYHDLDKLFDISSSPFMPKPISDKVNKMRFGVLSYDVSDEEIKKLSKVSLFGQRKNEAKYGRFNHEDMTLFEFLKIMDEVKNETIGWINKNSNYAPDLNL